MHSLVSLPLQILIWSIWGQQETCFSFFKVPQVILISGYHTKKCVLHKIGPHVFISESLLGEWSGVQRAGLLLPPRNHPLYWRRRDTQSKCGGRAEGKGFALGIHLRPPRFEQCREGLAAFAEATSGLILEMWWCKIVTVQSLNCPSGR